MTGKHDLAIHSSQLVAAEQMCRQIIDDVLMFLVGNSDLPKSILRCQNLPTKPLDLHIAIESQLLANAAAAAQAKHYLLSLDELLRELKETPDG